MKTHKNSVYVKLLVQKQQAPSENWKKNVEMMLLYHSN